MRLFIGAMIAIGAVAASAGDYQLVVQSDASACQDKYASVRASPEEVAADLLAFFQDRAFRISGLPGIVMNARLVFCSREDRQEFDRSLVDIGTQPRLAKEKEFRDFFLMVAAESLVNEVEARLGTRELARSARERLEHLRIEAPRWIAYRKTGKWPARTQR